MNRCSEKDQLLKAPSNSPVHLGTQAGQDETQRNLLFSSAFSEQPGDVSHLEKAPVIG
jgi:hypothetical protein